MNTTETERKRKTFAALSLLAQRSNIDCFGLDLEDQNRIADIGFWAWVRERENGLSVTKPMPQTRINIGVPEGENHGLTLPHPETVATPHRAIKREVGKPARKGGRPRINKDALSPAEKQRRYRAKRRKAFKPAFAA